MNAPLQKLVRKGAVDQSVVVRVTALSIAIGGEGVKTDGDETTTGLNFKYTRDGAIAVSFAPAALSFLTSSHTDGGFEHIAEGYYRVDVPDAAFARGASGVVITGVATSCRIYGCYVQLVDVGDQPFGQSQNVY